MSAIARFREVEEMLRNCAKGHDIQLKEHFRQVRYEGRTYPTLPKKNQIEVGHVRRMVRHLNIDRDCAKKFLPVPG